MDAEAVYQHLLSRLPSERFYSPTLAFEVTHFCTHNLALFDPNFLSLLRMSFPSLFKARVGFLVWVLGSPPFQLISVWGTGEVLGLGPLMYHNIQTVSSLTATREPNMLFHTCNPNRRETEARRSEVGVQGQPGLCDTWSQKADKARYL